MMYTSMYGVKSMRINKLIIMPSGTYNDQWKRPFTSGLNGQSFKQILSNVEEAKQITPTALAGVANQFIHPSAQPESKIVIPNGWAERRLRFFLEVQTETHIGAVQTEYISGYTEHGDLSFGNNFDPNMKFFINSIHTTRRTMMNTPMGQQTMQNVINSNHVIANDQYSGVMGPNQLYRLRPEDVFTHMEAAELGQEVQGDLTDARSFVGRKPILSRRKDGSASVFVSDVLNSYLQTARADYNMGDKSNVFESAKHAIKADNVDSDPFMSFVRGLRPDGGAGNAFYYGDLTRLDPNVVHVTHVPPLSPTLIATQHQVGQTAHWHSSDGETLFATCVAQALPGYMLEHCINKFHFRSTNRDVAGVITTAAIDVKSLMTGIDMTPFVQSLIFKLDSELFRDLSYNNQMDYAIEVRCDLLGDTAIRISINSGPFIEYVTPSFCDALMAPVTTMNQNNVFGIAQDFDNLLNHLQTSTATYSGQESFTTGGSFI